MDDDRLYRLTFSRSLAQHITQISNKPNLKVKRCKFVLGKELDKTTPTAAKLFAIVARKNSFCLRVSLIRELAHMLTDNTRYVTECWISGVEDDLT